MKCINNSIQLFIFLIFSVIVLSGCGDKQIEIPYQIHNPASQFSVLDQKEEYIASSFASELCVTEDNIESLINVDMEQATVAALFDLNSKNTIYAKNVHQRMNPASLTKIVTALVALKYGNMEDTVTVQNDIFFQEDSVQVSGIKKGDVFTLDQLMHLLLISSSNDAAIVIAEHISGSVEAFSELMNEEVNLLGATNSQFLNPHGLTQDGHYTTAYDLYLIFQEVIQYQLFNEIIHTDSYTTIYTNGRGEQKEITANTTNLYFKGTYQAPEHITVMGGKTGTTNAAGNCLILHTKDTQGHSYISIILQSIERGKMYLQMSDLLDEI